MHQDWILADSHFLGSWMLYDAMDLLAEFGAAHLCQKQQLTQVSLKLGLHLSDLSGTTSMPFDRR